MPDIQTEMQKILQAWEQPYPLTETTKETNVFTSTNNVSKDTFNYIRDNSGCSRNDVVRTLVNKGHKKSSVSSLVGQMLRQGLVWADSDGLLRPNAKEYAPIKSAQTIANRAKKAAKKYKTKNVPVSAGIASLIKEHTEKDRVQEIMNTISLPDAKRLHKALNEYFGSV